MYRNILKEYGVSEEDICSSKSMEVLLLVSLLYSDDKLFPRELLSERSVSWVDAIAFSDTITVVAESCINLEMLLKVNKYRKFVILNTGNTVASDLLLKREFSKVVL